MNAIGLWAIAAAEPSRTAVVEPDGAEISYRQLTADADRYAKGLQALGLRPGSSVAVMLQNSEAKLALYSRPSRPACISCQ